MKTAVLHTRIAPTVKTQAENVFSQIGLSSSDAIRIFFKQVILRKGLPFDVAIPNKETVATLKKSERDVGLRLLTRLKRPLRNGITCETTPADNQIRKGLGKDEKAGC